MLRFICPMVLAVTSAANAQEPAERYDDDGHFDQCNIIDAQRGWQRIDISSLTPVQMYVISPSRSSAEDLERFAGRFSWSVDDSRFERVGTLGHQGEEAEALTRYSEYKYNPDFPFGALLFRGSDRRRAPETAIGATLEEVPEGAINFSTQTLFAGITVGGGFLFLPSAVEWVELRINDTALADNGGSMVVCFS